MVALFDERVKALTVFRKPVRNREILNDHLTLIGILIHFDITIEIAPNLYKSKIYFSAFLLN